MKQYAKPIFLVFLLAGLFIAVVLAKQTENNTLFGNRLVTAEELEVLLRDKEPLETPSDLLEYQRQKIPYREDTNTFMLPIINSSVLTGSLSADNYGNIYIEEHEEEIFTGTELSIYVINEAQYYVTNIVLTDVPILTFETASFESENAYGKVCLYMPVDREINDYSFKTSAAKLSYESLGEVIPGKDRNYTLKLRKETKNGEYDTNSMNLAGLRKDDDWELDALFGCPSQILEFYAQWNQYCLAEGEELFTIYYQNVDFYLDGLYQGPYLLRVPIDDKQINYAEGEWLMNFDMSTAINADKIHQMSEIVTDVQELQLECYFRKIGKEIYAIPRRFYKN